jgi:putative transposase
MAERGVSVDHATLNCWVVHYSPLIASEAKKHKQSVASSWRMDVTYIKVKGQWAYPYRAIDKYGNTVDFMLSEHKDEVAATAFFKQAIGHNGLPSKVVIDKSGANNADFENINILIF